MERKTGKMINKYLTKLALAVILTGCMVMLHPQEVQAAADNSYVWICTVSTERINEMIEKDELPAPGETKYYNEKGLEVPSAGTPTWSIINNSGAYTMTLQKSLEYKVESDSSVAALSFFGNWTLNLGGNTLTINTPLAGIRANRATDKPSGKLTITNGTLNLNGVSGMDTGTSGLL